MSIVIYLHGFNSGPLSSKVSFFKAAFDKCDIGFIVPDLNVPSFSDLSVAAMLRLLDSILEAHKDDEVFVIASSLGATVLFGYLNSNYEYKSIIKKAVLLAPSLNFFKSELFKQQVLPKIEKNNPLEFFHFYYKKNVILNKNFLDEIKNYSFEDTEVTIPILLIHGLEDEIINYQISENFASINKNFVTLELVSDKHRLDADLDNIWLLTKGFFRIQDTYKINVLDLN